MSCFEIAEMQHADLRPLNTYWLGIRVTDLSWRDNGSVKEAQSIRRGGEDPRFTAQGLESRVHSAKLTISPSG